MSWFRVDNRLVHGQVIEAWLPYTGAKHLVVANDALASDVLRQQIVALAVPQRIAVHFVPIKELATVLCRCAQDTVFVLLADCQDAARVFSEGVAMPVLNIGNLHYAPGKRQLLPHVAVSEEDVAQLKYLTGQQVELDFRCVPTEPVRDLHDQFL